MEENVHVHVQKGLVQERPVQDLDGQEHPVQDLDVQKLPVQDLGVQDLGVQDLPVQDLCVQDLDVQELPDLLDHMHHYFKLETNKTIAFNI